MTRDNFKKHVESTIAELIAAAEQRSGRLLPRRYCFGYINPSRVLAPQAEVAEHITKEVFIDEQHIRPCFDLILGDILDDGTLLLCGYRAHYPPIPWQESWRGSKRPGPFNLMYAQQFLDRIGQQDGAANGSQPFRPE